MPTDVVQRPSQTRFMLRPGPRWSSLDRLRQLGAKRLIEDLKPGYVGHIKVKNQEYVIVHAQTFDEMYGLAQEIGRLSRGMLLVRQAVQLVLRMKHDHDREGSEIAFQHLHDLTFQLPELATEPAPSRELVFDEDDHVEHSDEEWDFELDPAQVKRPTFSTAG